MSHYVGVDLHGRCSVVVILHEEGRQLSWTRVNNSLLALVEAVLAAGPSPEVVLEATWGWYWAANVLAEAGARVHLAHLLGVKGFENRRVKNNQREARLLADLLRMGRLPESWIASGDIRELRKLVRYRHKLSRFRSGLKSQVHAVLGKEGVIPELTELWGPAGERFLAEVTLDESFRWKVDWLRELIDHHTFEITRLDPLIHDRLPADRGYQAIQQLSGVGRVLAAVLVAEIRDVHRFRRPEQLASWVGLTPRHRQSDTKVIRESISKQGSVLVRWAVIEAVACYRGDVPIKDTYRRITQPGGIKIARVAAARKLLTLVFYERRDNEIRCLHTKEAT